MHLRNQKVLPGSSRSMCSSSTSSSTSRTAIEGELKRIEMEFMERKQQLLERLEACSQRSGRRKSAAVGCQVPSFLMISLSNDIPFTKPEPSTMRYPGGEKIDENDGEEKRDMKKEGAEVEAKYDAKEEENVNSKEVAWKATEEKTDAKTDDIKGTAKEGAVSDVGCDKKEEKEVVLGTACEEKKIDEDSEERYDLQVLFGEKNNMEEMEGEWSKDDEDEAIELKDRSDVNGDSIHFKIGEDKENLIAGEYDLVEKHKYVNAKRSGRGSYNLDTGKNDARSVSVDRGGGNLKNRNEKRKKKTKKKTRQCRQDRKGALPHNDNCVN
ncbi:hypothetical protein GE061_001973 [Apolygus lucorum]|uniref:Uncharacterized protein n=1 Tax=Apolygus lucorum TaxID=248454 RepID=A0A8S9X5N3_APOLU|nr:hypothetical protein GE061_001973 [Apolygus lucorum]